MLGWSQQSHCACHCAATEHRPRATTARCRPYPSAVSVSTAAVEPTSGTGGPPAPPAGRPMQLASQPEHSGESAHPLRVRLSAARESTRVARAGSADLADPSLGIRKSTESREVGGVAARACARGLRGVGARDRRRQLHRRELRPVLSLDPLAIRHTQSTRRARGCWVSGGSSTCLAARQVLRRPRCSHTCTGCCSAARTA